MSRLQEYNPEFGVVFDWADDWLAQHPTTGGGGGVKPTGPTAQPQVSFQEQSIKDKLAQGGYFTKDQLISRGGKELGANTIIVGTDKYSLEPGGIYRPFGTASAADSKALASQMMAQGQTNRTAPGLATMAPEARPYAGNAGQFGTLAPNQAPQIGGIGDQWIHPGVGFPTGNNATINGVERGLNSMTAGRQGSATQFPVAPGFRREGDVGNSINFASGNTATGSLEPQMVFGPMSVTPQTAIPGSYQFGMGNVGDSGRAYGVPFNVGPGGAGLMNIGGNNVQVNSADKSSGYGFVLNAMPSSNVGALTGRNLSEDPASQAAQIMALNSAIAQNGYQSLLETNPNQFGGYHAGTGNGPFSGNGGTGQNTYWAGYSPMAAAVAPATSPATAPTAPAVPVYGPAVTSVGPYGPAFANDQQAAAAYAARGGAAAPSGAVAGSLVGGMLSAPAAGGLTQDQLDALAAAYGYAGGNYGTYGGDGGGYGIDGGTRFAGGGRIAVRPLGLPFTSYAMGTNGPKSMVTNGPMGLFPISPSGMPTGPMKALMGEDNADPGTAPNRERLTFSGLNNSMLNIKPLQPFATGGTILNRDSLMNGGTTGGNFSSSATQEDTTTTPGNTGIVTGNDGYNSAGPPPTQNGGFYGSNNGGGNTGGGYGNNVPPVTQPPDPNTPPPVDPNAPPVVPPVPPPPPVDPYANPLYTPDPSILAPWQAAAQELQKQNAARRNYNYRFTNAGLSGPQAIDVLQGDVPNQELAPGMYYDPSGQINKVISDITGTQSDLQKLGGMEDITPVQDRANYIGNGLDDFSRIRDLQISKVAADVATSQAGQGGIDAQSGLQAALAAKDALDSGQAPSPNYAQRVKDIDAAIAYWQRLVNDNSGAYNITSPSSPGSGAARIQAQIDTLQARLPKDANGNPMSESSMKTELALLRDRIAKNQQRTDLSGQLVNLKARGVPALNAPILAR